MPIITNWIAPCHCLINFFKSKEEDPNWTLTPLRLCDTHVKLKIRDPNILAHKIWQENQEENKKNAGNS